MIRHSLGTALFTLALFYSLGAVWFACAAAAAEPRDLRVFFGAAAVLVALIVVVLAAAGTVIW